ncbi:MAG: hypothetical protein ACJ75L_04705 [Gaiellaceae bacterium]
MKALSRLAARLAPLGAAAAASFLVVGAAGAAQTQTFTASYTGTASGYASGDKAFGTGTMSGRGRLIGRSTLKGFGVGNFTSSGCATFGGRVTLKGARGSLRLKMYSAHACAGSSAADSVPFSGRARVVGGTRAFAGARGALRFTGTYTRSTRAVSVSLRGRISY